MKNLFKKEIKKFIDLMLKTFHISFMYKFDSSSNTHLFKVLDEELYTSEEFDNFISEQIYDLIINQRVFHGICFIELDDKTISFKGAETYSSIELPIEQYFICDMSLDANLLSSMLGLNLEQKDMLPLFNSFPSFSETIEVKTEKNIIETSNSNFAGNNNYAMAA